MRAAIMRLRGDPAVSANMAGAFTRTNAAQLTPALGRQPTEGELYIAHFLGLRRRGETDQRGERQPGANAAAMFPQAAAANPGIFLNRSGQPRSVSEVYATLSGRFEVARAIGLRPQLCAAAQAVTPDPAVRHASHAASASDAAAAASRCRCRRCRRTATAVPVRCSPTGRGR